MKEEKRIERIISSVPVTGVWAVGLDGEGGQYKDRVVLLITTFVEYPKDQNSNAINFRYVTATEITDEGYVGDYNHPFNTEYYIGLIFDEPNQVPLPTEQHIPIPGWKS